jgi:flagellar basal-body rod protein FlgB
MYDGLEGVLDLRQAQHKLTAGNIANADTPFYLAKQMPFQELLTEVMEGALDGRAPDIEQLTARNIKETEAPPGALDGNSVNAESEASKMLTNSLLYNAVSGGLSRRLAILRFAASDGKT